MREERKNRLDLEILTTENDTRLLLCEIGVFQVFYPSLKELNQPLGIKCKCLIDTGAEFTLVDESVIDFVFPDLDKDSIPKERVHLADDRIIEIMSVLVNITLPHDNIKGYPVTAGVKKMAQSEYKAILGMDILRKIELHIDIENNEAYIMY